MVRSYKISGFGNFPHWTMTGPNTYSLTSTYNLNPDRTIMALQEELERTRRDAKFWETAACTDSLTGLYNRMELNRLDEHYHAKPDEHRDTNPSDAIMFIDLDDFGQINKKHGDHVGDEALRVVGKEIQNIVRDNDLPVRKGGDEFVVFLRGTNAETANHTVVQRMQKALNGDIVITCETGSFAVRGSIGVYDYNPELSPTQNLIQADALMRAEKVARKQAKAALQEGMPAPVAPPAPAPAPRF